MTSTSHTDARTGVSLEHRATPAATAAFCSEAARAGRPTSFEEARDVLSAVANHIADPLGMTTRSWCRYHLTHRAVIKIAQQWASGKLTGTDPWVLAGMTRALTANLIDRTGVWAVPLRVDEADRVVREAVWAADITGPVIEVTARPRAGRTWLTEQVTTELGVTPAPLADVLHAYRPVVVVRCAAHLSLAAGEALVRAGAGQRFTVITTGFGGPNGEQRGCLRERSQPVRPLHHSAGTVS